MDWPGIEAQAVCRLASGEAATTTVVAYTRNLRHGKSTPRAVSQGFAPTPGATLDIRLSPERMFELCEAHETVFAKKAVRMPRVGAATVAAETPTEEEAAPVHAPEKEDSQARDSLIKLFSQVLKEMQQDQGIGMGLDRQVRWTGTVAGGNAANASAAAANRATEVSTFTR